MQPSSPAHPHMKNVTTVLDIIDKSLNSLRSPSVVDRAANNNLSSSGNNSTVRTPRSTSSRRGGDPNSSANNSRVYGSSGGRRRRRQAPLGTPGRASLVAYDNNESEKDNEGYLNTLTTELLKHQRKCSALEAENESLKKKVSMLARRRPRANEGGRSPGRHVFRGRNTLYEPKNNKFDRSAQQFDDIATIVGKLHDHIALESQEIAQRNINTECVMTLESMRNLIDLSGEGAQHLRDDEMARTGYLQQQADLQANTQERTKTLEFEVNELKENERRLKEELVAFEAENMRLANELQDERHRNNERGRLNGNNTEQFLTMQAKLNTVTAEKEQLLLNCQQAETRITRFINEIDELKNIESDLLRKIETMKQGK